MWISLAVFGAGFFLGALVMSLCAIARCSECKTIARIIAGGE